MRALVLVAVLATQARAEPFEIRDPISGSTFTFTTGRVALRGTMLEVTLSDRDPGCGPPTASPHDPRFIFSLPAGPGGTFYAGAAFGVPSFLATEGGGLGFGAEGIAIKIDPVKLAERAHVTGRIDYLYGNGAFDALVCPKIDASKLRALPKTAPSTPFAGKIKN